MITAALGVGYLILAPSSTDLAAASYRSDLFGRVGFTLWDNSWFAGHHLPAYSVLSPGIGALLSPRLEAAIAMTAAAALFDALIGGRFPPRAVRIAAPWFAFGAGISLLSSRVAFDVGLAIGFASLLAAQRSRPRMAIALALLCPLASPVAGAFLALAGVSWALTGKARVLASAIGVCALAPIGLLALAFPEGGTQPFAENAFYPALFLVVVITLAIPRTRGDRLLAMLRVGGVLYALALIGSYVLSTAVGGNSVRLGALLAGPLAACMFLDAERGRRRGLLLVVLAPFLVYWQAKAPVTDLSTTASDPGVHASYYRPLLDELRGLGIGYGRRPARIEVVPLTDHWESRWMAPAIMLARGWERQLDRYRDHVFYSEVNGSPQPTPGSYRGWLSEQSVSYVALPDARLDNSALTESVLLRSGRLSYLHEIWHSAHWRLFAVEQPTPLVSLPATMSSVGTDSFTLDVPRAGDYTVRIHFTPYWALSGGHGCVSQSSGDWTRVHALGAGELHVEISFSLGRVFSHGPRCD
jgi:hypothetical protein